MRNHTKNCTLNQLVCSKLQGTPEFNPNGQMFLDEVGFFKKYSTDSLVLPVNKNCARCSRCACQVMTDSEADAAVTLEMEKKLKFDPTKESRRFSGEYIYRQDPRTLGLKDNRHTALKDAVHPHR